MRAQFFPPEQTARPVFLNTRYPVGAGVGLAAIDEAQIVAAVGSTAWATLSFEVDEQGIPAHINVDRASLELWGPQAIALISEWTFTPGMRNGMPVSVPCKLEFLWGRRDLQPQTLARWLSVN
ncbi:MAG: energy transducer TonB [Bryobacteraceae bacterium]